METLKLVTRPAVLILTWMIVSAYTISELSTVDRALTAPQTSAVAIAASRPKPSEMARAPRGGSR